MNGAPLWRCLVFMCSANVCCGPCQSHLHTTMRIRMWTLDSYMEMMFAMKAITHFQMLRQSPMHRYGRYLHSKICSFDVSPSAIIQVQPSLLYLQLVRVAVTTSTNGFRTFANAEPPHYSMHISNGIDNLLAQIEWICFKWMCLNTYSTIEVKFNALVTNNMPIGTLIHVIFGRNTVTSCAFELC